jgi:predicted dehydrogenase
MGSMHTGPVPSAARTYRVAIVGTGDIAGEHAAAIRGLRSRAALAAVVDLDRDRAAAFAAEWRVPATYGSMTRLLESEQLDLVHICTPPATHAALTIECLRAGVTPVLEKPPALSLEQLDLLLDAERETGLPVVVVFQHRFGPGAARLRALGSSSPAGRPLVALCNTLWYRGADYFSVPWRGRWETEGGGPTMGHGIHQFDLLLSILGDWEEVVALAGRQSRPTETEDVSAAVVRFTGGAIATVVNSLVSPRQTSQLRIDYEHATVELEHLYGYSDASWKLTERIPGVLGDAWHDGQDASGTSHGTQLRAVVDALDRGERPAVTLEDARRTLELAAAIYASSFTGRRVRAGEIAPGDPFYSAMQGAGAPWVAPPQTEERRAPAG